MEGKWNKAYSLLLIFLFFFFLFALDVFAVSSSQGTYKINEAINSEGAVLNTVKIYLDGVYLHHYAPETLTFCPDACDGIFGQHLILLEKTGYQDWSETKNINLGESFEVSPIMIALVPTSTITPVPTIAVTPTPTVTVVVTNTPTSTPVPVSYSNIYINEFLSNPQDGNEKVEIKNGNNFSVSLVNWQIDDIENAGHSPKVFSADISPSGLFTIDLGTNSFLNNDGDQVRLLDWLGVQKDRKDYSSSIENLSWSKDRNSNWCQLGQSFNSENSDCSIPTTVPTNVPTPTNTVLPSKTPTPTKKITPTPTPSETIKVLPTSNVLGENTSNNLTLSEDNFTGTLSGEKNQSENKIKSSYLFLIPIVVGVGLIVFSIIMLINKNKN